MRSIREQLIRSLSVRSPARLEYRVCSTIYNFERGKREDNRFPLRLPSFVWTPRFGKFSKFSVELGRRNGGFSTDFRERERENNVSLPGHWKFSCTRVAEFGADDPRVVHGRLKSNFTGADVR